MSGLVLDFDETPHMRTDWPLMPSTGEMGSVVEGMSGLVFAGPSGSGKKELRDRVLGQRDHPLPSVSEQGDAWSIETKYFTAEVSVAMAETPADIASWGHKCEVSAS